MHPAKTMVVDCPSAKPLPLRRDWYPDATWVKGLPTAADFRTWLQGLDVVYTAETGYGQALWPEADRLGVRTVLHANFEFLDRRDQPTVWAAPSMWHFGEFPTGSVFLPVPIRPTAPDVPKTSASRLLHIVGRPAVHDRNGTSDLLQALQHIQSRVTVTVKCQDPGYVAGLIRDHRVRTPDNVTLVVDTGDVPDNSDLYQGQDVLVMPRRFGGLCLPAQEALGSGMPVIMPDISPNTWLPNEWLVPASWQREFMAKNRITVYATDPILLATKIDELATDQTMFMQAQEKARTLAKTLSWDNLLPRYREVLG